MVRLMCLAMLQHLFLFSKEGGALILNGHSAPMFMGLFGGGIDLDSECLCPKAAS